MAGVLNYDNYINIFATAEDVKQTFPRDQYTLTYDFDDLGADGWTAEFSWMNLVIDQIKYTVDGTPDFSKSFCIGFFEVDQGSGVQYDSTTISLPANMYTGPILPGAERNVPVTIVNINWTKGTANFQRQLLLIQNWEPGTEILDPTLNPDYIPIIESHPVIVSFTLSTTTAFVGTTISVSSVATSTHIGSIVNDYDIKLTPPIFAQFGNNPVISSSKFVDGLGLTEFALTTQFVDQTITTTTNYTIVSSSTVATTGTVFGRTVNTSSVFTLSADVYRDHQLRLQWYYDKETGFRSGITGSQTLRVNTSQDYVYVGRPLQLTVTQNSQFQRLNQTSTFVVSHNISSSTAITGLVTLYADYTPANTTTTSVVTIGTGTFNVEGDLTIATVLNSGTYVLQAYYAGNMGLDIYHPMYLNTWTNTLTHYVQLGRELAMTELLIEENTNTDVLYVHAIDDGLWEGTITGQVTFFNNDIAIGTSTFSRYIYEVVDSNNVQSYRVPTPGHYPYPDASRLGFVNRLPGDNDAPFAENYTRFTAPYSITQYTWNYAAAPTYYANLKYNSKELDWPPGDGPINTIALQNTEDPTRVPTLPFTITLPEANHPVFVSTSLDENGNPTTDPNPQTRLTCVEYLGTATYTYPSVTFTRNVDYRNVTQYQLTQGPPWSGINTRYFVDNTIYISTAPAGPHGIERGRPPGSSYNDLPAGYARAPGTRYHWTNARSTSIVNGQTVTNTYTIDIGDDPPYQFTVAGTSSGICQVFRFAEEIPSPNFVTYTRDLTIVGGKSWRYYPDRDTYHRFVSGITSSRFNQIDADSVGYYANQRHDVPVETVNLTVKSRSHIAKITLPKNVVDLNGSFRASFSGDIAATGVGFYPEEISFLDQASTAIQVSTDANVRQKLGFTLGGFNYINGQYFPASDIDSAISSNPDNDWIKLLPRDGSWEEKRPIIYKDPYSQNSDTLELDPNPYRNYTPGGMLINRSFGADNPYAGSAYRYRINYTDYNSLMTNDITAVVPNIRITTSATTTATLSYPNILTPNRYIGDQRNIPQSYTKNLGWLNRRSAEGNITVVNTSTGQVIATRTLSKIPSVPEVVRNRSDNGLYIETLKYINLPEVVRPDRYPNQAWTTDSTKFSRLDILNTSSYTTSSTATIVVPMVSVYTGTDKLSATTSSPVTLNMDGALYIAEFATTATSWPAVPSQLDILLHSGVYSLGSGYLWICSDQEIIFPPVETPTGSVPYNIGRQGTDGSKWQFYVRYEQWTADGSSLIKTSTVTPLFNEFDTKWQPTVWQSGYGGQYPTSWNFDPYGPPLTNFRLDDPNDTANYLFKIYFVAQAKAQAILPYVKQGAELEFTFKSLTLRTSSNRLSGPVLYSQSY